VDLKNHLGKRCIGERVREIIKFNLTIQVHSFPLKAGFKGCLINPEPLKQGFF